MRRLSRRAAFEKEAFVKATWQLAFVQAGGVWQCGIRQVGRRLKTRRSSRQRGSGSLSRRAAFGNAAFVKAGGPASPRSMQKAMQIIVEGLSSTRSKFISQTATKIVCSTLLHSSAFLPRRERNMGQRGKGVVSLTRSY
jgi:hypothetical protein